MLNLHRIIVVAFVLSAIACAAQELIDDADWRTVAEDTESHRLGLARLQRFNETEPFLPRAEDGKAARALDSACASGLDRTCLAYLRDHPSAARRAVADNPAYWSSYGALLQVTPLQRVAPVDLEKYHRTDIIEAANHWARNELLTHGTLDIAEMHFVVQAHRRLLAQSSFLIDKMIFTATAGIIFPAINVVMAQRANQLLDGEQTKLLDEMLQPLTHAERSLRRVFRGEYQYVLRLADEDPDVNEAVLSDLLRMYAYISERSERAWAEYWGGGLDIWADVPIYTIQDWIPGYYYANNLRYLEAHLALLRALREVYAGRVSPGIPARPPPARWHWQWQVADQALCLEPGDINASLRDSGEVATICMEYLDQKSVALQPAG